MKKAALLSAITFALVACAPTNQAAVGNAQAAAQAAQNAPIQYAAPSADVFASVITTISTDPGIPAYKHPFSAGENMQRVPGGWAITESNQAGGSIKARSDSKLLLITGTDSGQRESHFVTVTLVSTSTGTMVTISAPDRAAYMRDKILAELDAKFKRQ